jgi:hypothetical protein
MSLADLLPGRLGPAGRIPGRIADLHGPLSGIIMLPRNLAWPGMRECDVSDGGKRRTMYAMVLTRGKRNDIARLVNPALLEQDWPLIASSLRQRLRRRCERQLGLGRLAQAGAPAAAATTASPPR